MKNPKFTVIRLTGASLLRIQANHLSHVRIDFCLAFFALQDGDCEDQQEYILAKHTASSHSACPSASKTG
jgi:hypothetical protein